MNGCNFSRSKLVGVSFRGSSLVFGKFVGADVRGADLRGADLTNADFSGAEVSGMDVTGATLDGARFQGATGLDAVKGMAGVAPAAAASP
jgi:uncharacterized protein YjbI with pentapeptide repeats